MTVVVAGTALPALAWLCSAESAELYGSARLLEELHVDTVVWVPPCETFPRESGAACWLLYRPNQSVWCNCAGNLFILEMVDPDAKP